MTQLWDRFRNRTRRFVWQASHQQIAIAANHPQLGTVTVQLNGTPVNQVHTTTVVVSNDSNEDAKEVILTITFQGIGHIISSTGYIEGTLTPIPFDPAYAALYTGASAAQIAILETYVIHKIPVFNRRQKARFDLLVRDDAPQPNVQLSCNHPGFRLEFEPTAGIQVDGMPYAPALGLGFLLTGPTLALICFYAGYRHPIMVPFVGWLMGVFCPRIGAVGLKSWKALGRLLG